MLDQFIEIEHKVEQNKQLIETKYIQWLFATTWFGPAEKLKNCAVVPRGWLHGIRAFSCTGALISTSNGWYIDWRVGAFSVQ